MAYITTTHQVSIGKACSIKQLSKSMFYYKSCKDDRAVIDKLTVLAQKYPRRGCDKLYAMIRSEELRWNYKRVRRVYCLEAESAQEDEKRLPARIKEPLNVPLAINKKLADGFHE